MSVTLPDMAFTGLVSAQVIIPMDSGIARDAVTNTWWFVSRTLDDNYEAMSDDINNALQQFYIDISGLLSLNVSPANVRVKYTAVAGPQPRYPFREEVWDIGTVGSSIAPAEVAAVLSFQAARESGQEQARRRGRVYIGPLGVSSLGERPSSTVVNTLATAASDLLTSMNLSTAAAWAVYSRVNNGAPWVTDGWVDNAWDVQRRRGQDPTARTTWTA